MKKSYKKKERRPPSKDEKKRGKILSPRNMKACTQHQHRPLAKHRGDENPEYRYREEQIL
jgi:hypothetical protein